MNLEDKMKKRFDENLDNVVKNPYVKKKAFPLWAKLAIPLGSVVTVGLVASIILPMALSNVVDTPNLDKLKLLRSPENLSHEYQSSDIYESGYRGFKKQLKSFSTSLSESFASVEYDNDKNIVFSPLSIELCLGLAVRSSNNNTRKELLDAFGVDYETFNKYYKLLFNENTKTFFGEQNAYQGEVSLTNSIWIDDEVSLYDSGLDALRDDYYCYSYQADFNNRNKETNLAIKEFINEKTHGLLNPDLELPPQTVFALMNTLYMKDVWKYDSEALHFASKDITFTNANKTISNKRLLEGLYFEGKVLDKEDYSSFFTISNHGIRFNFIKPKENKTIKEVFTKANIDEVLDSKNYIYQDDEKMERYYTNCIFPEYTAESNLDFKDILKERYGIKDFFNTSCDFSNLCNFDVYCARLKHFAKLIVDKKGAEGAAVTIGGMEASAKNPDEYVNVYETYIVNQEFGYVVSYKDNILFSGIVSNIDK